MIRPELLWLNLGMQWWETVSLKTVLGGWTQSLLYREKSEREKQISYINVYMESRKMVLMNLFAGAEIGTDREQTCTQRRWD